MGVRSMYTSVIEDRGEQPSHFRLGRPRGDPERIGDCRRYALLRHPELREWLCCRRFRPRDLRSRRSEHSTESLCQRVKSPTLMHSDSARPMSVSGALCQGTPTVNQSVHRAQRRRSHFNGQQRDRSRNQNRPLFRTVSHPCGQPAADHPAPEQSGRRRQGRSQRLQRSGRLSLDTRPWYRFYCTDGGHCRFPP
jgi:hypothetical protein